MNLKGIKLTWLEYSTFRVETPGGTIAEFKKLAANVEVLEMKPGVTICG
jgi:hypothetical protein